MGGSLSETHSYLGSFLWWAPPLLLTTALTLLDLLLASSLLPLLLLQLAQTLLVLPLLLLPLLLFQAFTLLALCDKRKSIMSHVDPTTVAPSE